MNSAIHHFGRNERRLLLAAEERARKSGKWGDWEKITFPRGSAGRHWAAEFQTAYRNKVFSVLVRSVSDGTGGAVVHLAISSLSGIRPSWWEAQRIKDGICGPEATAVEIYPPRSEVVDGADMYHLWALPSPLPFGLAEPGHG